jgi:hypothetical protein
METTITARMDKTVFTIGTLTDDPDDLAYWHSRSPEERLEALELMRQVMYGYDPLSARLQRILAVIDGASG